MVEEQTAFLYELARNSEELKLLEYLTEAEKPIVRYRAAELIGGLPSSTTSDVQKPVTQTLVRTAKHDDHDAVRAASMDALYLRDESALERLIGEIAAGGIDDPPMWMRIDRLTEWLESDHAEFRLVAAAAAGKISDERAVPKLVGCFRHPDVRVRTRAAVACGKIGDPRCIDALTARLEDSHDQVRREAATALASIGTEAAIEALAPGARSDTESVRVIAHDALGADDSLESLGLLVEGLDDRSDLVRRTATRSLLEILANAPPERSHTVRNEIVNEIADAEPRDIESQLLSILGGNQPAHIRRNATWLLGHLVDNTSDRLEDVQATLIDALDDPDEITAKFATSALVELEDSTLVDHLQAFVKQESISETARSRANFILEKIERSRGPSREAVTNSVEFTYIDDPSDYTASKRDRDRDRTDESS